jgi:small subunit ribosomal protein S8
MLTRIRNALAVHRDWVVAPSSGIKKAMVSLLKDEGYVQDFQVAQDGKFEVLRIRLRYDGQDQSVISGLRRVSKPGLRIYVDRKELPRFYGGRGIAIISTSQGLMSGQQAWSKGIGGELLCYVW